MKYIDKKSGDIYQLYLYNYKKVFVLALPVNGLSAISNDILKIYIAVALLYVQDM